MKIIQTDTLKLAEEILEDIENQVLPKIPLYKSHPRYKELLQIIEELKRNTLAPHPSINFCATMDYDELMWNRPLMSKLGTLKEMIEYLVFFKN